MLALFNGKFGITLKEILMTDQSKLFTRSLAPGLWSDFVAYFEFQDSCGGCWCMNHRLPSGLDFDGEAAKLAMKQLVETQRVFGLLAYSEGDVVPVGWLALDRRSTLPGHDCVDQDLLSRSENWSIHCVTSRRDYRDQGVEDLLCHV